MRLWQSSKSWHVIGMASEMMMMITTITNQQLLPKQRWISRQCCMAACKRVFAVFVSLNWRCSHNNNNYYNQLHIKQVYCCHLAATDGSISMIFSVDESACVPLNSRQPNLRHPTILASSLNWILARRDRLGFQTSLRGARGSCESLSFARLISERVHIIHSTAAARLWWSG